MFIFNVYAKFLKWRGIESTAEVLDIAEDFNGGPHVVPALDLGRDDDVHHLKSCEGESEEDQVKDVQQDYHEGPPDDIVVRVEDVEDDHAHRHDEVH